MSIYTSQGTIRIHYNITGENCHKTTIYFVPENDYSIKHRNENYAVFVPQSCGCSEQSCDCKSQSCKNAVIRKYNPDKDDWIKIHVADGIIGCMGIISDAATHQKKVEVKVEVKTTLAKMAESKISEIAPEIAKKVDEAMDDDTRNKAVEQGMKEMLEKLTESKISEIAKKVDEATDDDARNKSVEQGMNAMLKKLVEVANESKQCFKLIGITVPAK